MDEQIERIKCHVRRVNSTATDDELLTFAVEETIDRVLLYLNRDDLPNNLLRVIARIVSGVYNQTAANLNNVGADQAVKSLSDNGQSITFSENAKQYLATSTDHELFGGFAKLLAPHRRVNVVA
ncbi:hypothetical protein FWH13_01500 [Candidatus Saccharibacteria bacterium]|nr:hypothetical protein [Candidatus Saccharibacteria bacterium]